MRFQQHRGYLRRGRIVISLRSPAYSLPVNVRGFSDLNTKTHGALSVGLTNAVPTASRLFAPRPHCYILAIARLFPPRERSWILRSEYKDPRSAVRGLDECGSNSIAAICAAAALLYPCDRPPIPSP